MRCTLTQLARHELEQARRMKLLLRQTLDDTRRFHIPAAVPPSSYAAIWKTEKFEDDFMWNEKEQISIERHLVVIPGTACVFFYLVPRLFIRLSSYLYSCFVAHGSHFE